MPVGKKYLVLYVSPEVWTELMKLKIDLREESMDKMIRILLDNYKGRI